MASDKKEKRDNLDLLMTAMVVMAEGNSLVLLKDCRRTAALGPLEPLILKPPDNSVGH